MSRWVYGAGAIMSTLATALVLGFTAWTPTEDWAFLGAVGASVVGLLLGTLVLMYLLR